MLWPRSPAFSDGCRKVYSCIGAVNVQHSRPCALPRAASQLRWLEELQDAGFEADSKSLLLTAVQAGNLRSADTYFHAAVREGVDLQDVNFAPVIRAAAGIRQSARETVNLWCLRVEEVGAGTSSCRSDILNVIALHGEFCHMETWFDRALVMGVKPGLDFLHAAIENAALQRNLSAAYYWLA
eukprot:4688777-Amphidinium_carterae.1